MWYAPARLNVQLLQTGGLSKMPGCEEGAGDSEGEGMACIQCGRARRRVNQRLKQFHDEIAFAFRDEQPRDVPQTFENCGSVYPSPVRTAVRACLTRLRLSSLAPALQQALARLHIDRMVEGCCWPSTACLAFSTSWPNGKA